MEIIRVKKAGIKELYLFSLWIYTFIGIIGSSVIDIRIISKGVNAFVLTMLVLVFFIKRYFSVKELCIYIGLIIAFFIVSVTTSHTTLLIFLLFILCAGCCEFEKMVKISISAQLTGIILIVFLSICGLIQDYTYDHLNSIAHSMGFRYYSTLPFHMIYIVCMYFYLKKGEKINFITLGMIAVANYLIYILTTDRLVFYLEIIILLMYLVLIKADKINLSKKWITRAVTPMFPLAALFIYFLTVNYNPTNAILFKLNRAIFGGRLSSGYYAMQQYSITLFGQETRFIGGYELAYGDLSSGQYYTFIDSGFLNTLISQGVIFIIVVLIMYIILYRYSTKNNDKELFVWMTMILIFSMLNATWTSLIYNPITLLVPQIIRKRKTQIIISA